EAFVYGHPRRDGGVGVLDAQQVDGDCGGLVLPELVAARLVAASASAPDADGDVTAREAVDERPPSGWCAGSAGVPVVEVDRDQQIAGAHPGRSGHLDIVAEVVAGTEGTDLGGQHSPPRIAFPQVTAMRRGTALRARARPRSRGCR